MSTLWVILNDDKTEIVEVFETNDADSKRHWDKFFECKQGAAFCRRTTAKAQRDGGWADEVKWYHSYFYWNDHSNWACGPPDGIGWSACLAIPESIKMLELLE